MATAPVPGSPRPHSRLTVRVRRDVLADRTAFRLVASTAGRPDEAAIVRVGEELALAEALFRRRGWIDDPASYHQAPPPPADVRTRSRTTGRIRYTSLSWLDGYECRAEEPGALRYAAYRANRVARASVLEHRGAARPWLVCLHGFGMGSPAMDLRAFRALHLHRDLGLNVAFLTLPLHGRRRPPGTRLGAFPSFELLDNVHALAQSVWDVRQLLTYIRARSDQAVGVMGLSLGGYVTALTAALADIDAAVLLIPAVDIGALMQDAGANLTQSIPPEILENGQKVMRVVAPLALTPRVALDRRMIVAATLDRFARPTTQAVALWHHWGEPELHWFHSGHVGFFWAKGMQAMVDDALRRFGLAR